jgi:NAD(P)H-nitrite reductase large subunit
MEEIYQGILSESIKNLDQVLLVVNSFKVQMTDGKRMELIGAAATRIDANYNDLKRFNQQNIILSIQRAKSLSEISALKQMYHVE